MTFKTYPEGADPVRLGPAQRADFVEIPELSGETGVMYLRLVVSDDSCSPAASAPLGIRLRADNGLPVKLGKSPALTDILDDQNEPVATASWTPEEAGIFLVDIAIQRPASLWEFEITNSNPNPRCYTWTVASSDDEARQPWIDIPSFEDLGDIRDLPMDEYGKYRGATQLTNRGSGPLNILYQELDSGEPFFEIFDWAGEVIEPHMCTWYDLRLDPYADIPPVDGVYQAELHIGSNTSNNPPDGRHVIGFRATAPEI